MTTDACVKHPQRIHIEQHTFMGMAWFAAWLLMIGYLHLDFLERCSGHGLLWPYYIGVPRRRAHALIRASATRSLADSWTCLFAEPAPELIHSTSSL